MGKIATVSLFFVAILSGCHTPPTSVQAPATVATTPPDTANDMKIWDRKMENTTGHGEVIGMVTISGILQHTKGQMGFVGEMLIPADFLRGNHPSGWKPEYESLVGKNVEAHGEHYRYYCGPIEQCLGGGVINSLRDITYLRAKD